MTLAQSLLPIIIFWAVIGGLGASLLLPAMQSLIHGNFEGEAQKRVYALVGASAAIAAAVGPLLGGFITTFLSWRVAFLLEALIIAVVLSRHQARSRRAVHRAPGRWTSSGRSCPSWAWAASCSASWSGRRAAKSVGALLAVGAVGLGGLVYWLVRRKRRNKPTLLDPDLFQSKTFRFGATGQMLQQIALGGTMIVLPIYLQMVLGYNAMLVGAVDRPALAHACSRSPCSPGRGPGRGARPASSGGASCSWSWDWWCSSRSCRARTRAGGS